jgi:hypothetical protein
MCCEIADAGNSNPDFSRWFNALLEQEKWASMPHGPVLGDLHPDRVTTVGGNADGGCAFLDRGKALKQGLGIGIREAGDY